MAVDQVVEGIYIGGAPAVDHADALRAAGVTRVLKLSTLEQAWPDDFVVFDNALNDSEFVPLDMLQRGVAFVRAQREAGHSVLIACHAGVSRSSTFVMAYLMDALGYDLREAWARLSAQHGAAWPMPQMWESLLAHFDHGYQMDDVHAWLEAARP
ncbi:MAG: dual specificity protein phosphatase family protein [Anaerolineae bacterium]|nr:dual specificity protein phosphatase family protein [Anaerolineae bacterium]